MLSSWFSSKSSSASRQSRVLRTSSPIRPSAAPEPPKPETKAAPTDSHPVPQPSRSLSTLEPSTSFSPFSSQSAIPPSDSHAYIDDRSPYGIRSLRHPGPPLVGTGEEEEEEEEEEEKVFGNAPKGIENKRSRKGKGKAPETTGLPFTPQDAMLADVFQFPLRTTHDGSGVPVSSAQTTSLDLGGSEWIPRSTSTVGGSTQPMLLPVFDPYTGARIGDHPVPTGPSEQGQPWGKSQSFPTTGESDIWTHLARIHELQAEVASMHTEMEGLGSAGRNGADGGGFTRIRTGAGASNDDDPPPPDIRLSASDGHSDVSIEDGDGDDPETSAKKKRDEEFAKLADQFAARKAAIGQIMNKLGGLSDALKAFHALPIPAMDLGQTATSRTNTVSSAASGRSVPSPPQHARPSTSSSVPLTVRPPEKLIHEAAHVDSPLKMDHEPPASGRKLP